MTTRTISKQRFNAKSHLRDVFQFYCDHNARVESQGTVQRYFATVISLEKYLKRTATVADLNPDTYGGWINFRRDVCGVAPSTLHGEAQKLCVLWRWLARRRDWDDCEVQLPKKFLQDNTTWIKDEYARIEQAARVCDWYVGEVPGRIYWPAMLGIAVETGERFGAIHKMEAHHVDFDRLLVTFPRENRKGKTRDLIRPISEQTAADLKVLFARRPLRPFAALLQPSMYHPMRRLLLDAGLPAGRSRLFHAIRRYHATQITIAGGNAQRSLDHSDGRVTERYIDKTQLPAQPLVPRPAFNVIDATTGTMLQGQAPQLAPPAPAPDAWSKGMSKLREALAPKPDQFEGGEWL